MLPRSPSERAPARSGQAVDGSAGRERSNQGAGKLLYMVEIQWSARLRQARSVWFLWFVLFIWLLGSSG